MNRVKIINRTPHPIRILQENGTLVTQFPASDDPIRLNVAIDQYTMVNGIPISRSVFSRPANMPCQDDNTCYIVSQMVKQAFPERKDLLVPAELVRDAFGTVLGCRSLGTRSL